MNHISDIRESSQETRRALNSASMIKDVFFVEVVFKLEPVGRAGGN